jgi:hypothetical protein
MLYSEFLTFGYSTVAVACLTLADWTTQCAITADTQSRTSAEPTAAGTRSVVTELAAFAGLDMWHIAPDLDQCIATLRPLHCLIMGLETWGSPAAADLGLLAPVLARYTHNGFLRASDK